MSDLVQVRLLALADALPDGGAVTLDAAALRRLAGVEPEREAGAVAPIADLTAEEVGAELGRSASTVRAWCAAGRIPGAYRLRGREWRVPRARLREYLDSQAEASEPESGPQGDGHVDLGRWRKHYPRKRSER